MLKVAPVASDSLESYALSPPASSVHGFSWQEHWSGFPCPPPGDLLDPGIEPTSLTSPHWQAGSSPLVPPRKPNRLYQNSEIKTSFHRTRQLEGAHKQSGLVPSPSKQENRHLTKPAALPGPLARQRLKAAADVVQREGWIKPRKEPQPPLNSDR